MHKMGYIVIVCRSFHRNRIKMGQYFVFVSFDLGGISMLYVVDCNAMHHFILEGEGILP